MRTRLAALLAVLTGLTLTALAPAPAHATSPVDTSSYGRLMLVLDSSGSMAEPAGDGRTKIADAKRALGSVIDGLPSSAAVGLRVFGATVFSKRDPGACNDTQLAVPPATGNRADLRGAVASYKPYGETPIPAALRAAAKDLGDEGKRSIVLVSDGESTCAPNPCSVATEIADSGIDVQIDVVGLSVSGKARDQLRCIAKAGHGTYYDAHDANGLARSLERSSTRATQPFTAEGTPVTGTTSSTAAPTIGAGTWLDRTPTKAHPLFYLIKRTIPGSTIHVGVASQPGATLHSIQVSLLSPSDQDDCGSDVGENGTYLDHSRLLLAGTSSKDDRTDADAQDCWESDALLLNLQDTSLDKTHQRTPMQIVVTEEPPVSNAQTLPPTANDGRDATWTHMPVTGAVHPTSYGTTFSTAPTLTDGIYSSSITPDEVQLYRVPLDWGQSLQAEIRVPAYAQERAADLDVVYADIVSPDRSVVSAVFPHDAGGKSLSDTESGIVSSSQETLVRTMSLPVRYRNRNSYSSSVQPTSIKGDYYVMVSLSRNYQGRNDIIPFDLVIKRTGAAGQGAPTYVGGALTGPTAPATPSATPSGTTSAGPSESPSDSPSAEPSEQTTAASADGPADSGGDSHHTVLVAAGFGGLGVLVLGGAALVLLLRRPPRG